MGLVIGLDAGPLRATSHSRLETILCVWRMAKPCCDHVGRNVLAQRDRCTQCVPSTSPSGHKRMAIAGVAHSEREKGPGGIEPPPRRTSGDSRWFWRKYATSCVREGTARARASLFTSWPSWRATSWSSWRATSWPRASPRRAWPLRASWPRASWPPSS